MQPGLGLRSTEAHPQPQPQGKGPTAPQLSFRFVDRGDKERTCSLTQRASAQELAQLEDQTRIQDSGAVPTPVSHEDLQAPFRMQLCLSGFPPRLPAKPASASFPSALWKQRSPHVWWNTCRPGLRGPPGPGRLWLPGSSALSKHLSGTLGSVILFGFCLWVSSPSPGPPPCSVARHLCTTGPHSGCLPLSSPTSPPPASPKSGPTHWRLACIWGPRACP
ncbi:uncharacterized protein LOC116667667 [Camelus ferus]|uniref:Uncharacterized protein LOC116667667 n=1 Tax=Camelus ferus TaxID=419612 RepID=A0A8B8U504_CAMFR|nr:uncharacterized protein LOC116667667 [Camelus ferus]